MVKMKVNKYNKKGFLLAEETLKVILAVIAIGFLVFLLFSLYKAGKDSKDFELAKESLNFLEQEINAEKTSVDIYNPKGWFIVSWIKGQGNNLKFCENLGLTNCLCIVKNDDDGICIENKKQLRIQQPIPIEPPLTLSIDYQNKVISKA